MKKKYIVIILCSIAFIIIIRLLFIFGLFNLLFSNSEIEVNTDISKYNDYIGINAYEEYKDKWGMDEDIFPVNITSYMNVIDYKMVYYNPWDAQYLSYLVVDYNRNDYVKEIKRLKDYNSTNYIDYYGVRGFDKYALLAMQADSYHGFVYAITDGESKIIYVELIFCNYQYDFDYKEYIDNDYLPVGFDASTDNSYQKRMLDY